MGPKRPVTDVWGETLFAAETMFLWLGLLGSNRNWKKTPVYRDTQRDWFLKYSDEIFRNTHLEYIQSDNDKNGRNHINGHSLRSVLYRQVYNNIIFFCFLRTFILKQTHMCVFAIINWESPLHFGGQQD